MRRDVVGQGPSKPYHLPLINNKQLKIFKIFGNKYFKRNAQGRRWSGTVEALPHKKVDGYFFPRAMLMIRETARKTVLNAK